MADKLRLLLITQCPPSLELGGSKSQLELADELRMRGWHCHVAGPDASQIASPDALLRKSWDVIDWDIHLAIPRSAIPAHTLSLARIPFLNLHLQGGRLPWPQGRWRWRRRAQHLLRPWRGGRSEIQKLADSQAKVLLGLSQADLLNTWNSADTRLLLEQGWIGPERLIELPPGLPVTRLQAFAKAAEQRPATRSGRPPLLVMLGTFDFRKGCLDLPPLLSLLRRHHSSLRLRLLGTCGLFRTEREVRRYFPANLQQAVEVVPSFSATDLPRLLTDADVGVFTSYLEGFGIAIIEQLAAGLPVFAYNVPGPCDSLPPQWLVPAGDYRELARRISQFLDQPENLQIQNQEEARQRAQRYALNTLADQWDQVYREGIASIRR